MYGRSTSPSVHAASAHWAWHSLWFPPDLLLDLLKGHHIHAFAGERGRIRSLVIGVTRLQHAAVQLVDPPDFFLSVVNLQPAGLLAEVEGDRPGKHFIVVDEVLKLVSAEDEPRGRLGRLALQLLAVEKLRLQFPGA